MKKLFLIVVTAIISVTCFSQTSFDSLMFDQVNEFRTINDQEPFVYSSDAYEVALEHSTYMAQVGQNVQYRIVDSDTLHDVLDIPQYAGTVSITGYVQEYDVDTYTKYTTAEMANALFNGYIADYVSSKILLIREDVGHGTSYHAAIASKKGIDGNVYVTIMIHTAE